MSNTAFQSRQLETIRTDRKTAAQKFASTGAIAEIGICSNGATFTLNTLNGPRRPNWENVEFQSPIAAVKAYAAASFKTGSLRKNGHGRFLVMA